MTYGSTPTDSNNTPLSSVYTPNTASSNLTALEGGPVSTDSNSQKSAPASMYVKDGLDVTQGLTTDAAVTGDNAGTVSAKLRGLSKMWFDIWDSVNHRFRVDGSGVTQPISATSLPLPTGASTSAKQPALGTAGSAASDVLSVQGVTSMTPLKVDGSAAMQPVQQADLSTSGTISTAQPLIGTLVANAVVVLAMGQGQSTWKAQLLAGTGGFTSGTTIVVDKSLDNTTSWLVSSFKVGGSLTNTTVQSVTGPGPLELTGNGSAITHIRIRCSVLNSTETIATTIRGGAGTADVGLISSIPTGTNSIGQVTANAGTNLNTSTLALETGGNLATLVTNTADLLADGDHLATIDTSTAASKTDLDTIVTNTNKIPASPAQEAGNLATLVTNTADLLADGDHLATIDTSTSSTATNTSNTATNTSNTNTATGTKTDTKATDGSTTAWSVIALLKGIIDKLLSTLAVTQSGTWTVQPGNTANTTAWKVDGSAVVQPTSVTSLPLPTGASTSAKQPALGTAGTASADVLSVQGVTSMTALKVDGSAVTQPVSGTITANAGTNMSTASLALETGGNLASLVTNTADLLADGDHLATIDSGIASLVTNTADLLADGDNLATIATNTTGLATDAHASTTATNTTTIAGAVTSSKMAVKAASGDFADGADTAQGTTTQAKATDATTTSWSVIQLLKGIFNALLNAIAVTQSGTWTVQPGNTANTTAWKVDGSAVTQPVSGTITANAGTNTSTASLALETGGNLATLVTNTADLLADGDHLATIDTNTAQIPAKGTAVMTGSTPVTIATDDTQITAIKNSVANIGAKGSATSANSNPVVIASDQGAVPMKLSTVAVYSLASTTTSGATQNSGDFTVGAYREIAIDINTTAQAGTSPTLQIFYERKGADGIYYVLWQSAVLTAATNTLSTSIGAGMAYTQSLGATGRLRWVIGGSATPTFTFSASIQGK